MNQSNAGFEMFSLAGEVVAITGGGGMLGFEHAAAVAGVGARPVLIDVNAEALRRNAERLLDEYQVEPLTVLADITSLGAVQQAQAEIEAAVGPVSVLINNAARNPKVDGADGVNFSRLEHFPDDQWDLDLAVGLGGAFHCAKVFGSKMAQMGHGVILNVASDLGVIAPDQRLYRVDGVPEEQQPVKPVTYSVVKHGLIGLTKYLATYWCDQGVRCNALSPGGVYAGQNDIFVSKLARLIPMGRMARVDEYRGAVIFMCSPASSYLNGANLVMDGGRSTW